MENFTGRLAATFVLYTARLRHLLAATSRRGGNGQAKPRFSNDITDLSMGLFNLASPPSSPPYADQSLFANVLATDFGKFGVIAALRAVQAHFLCVGYSWLSS